MIIDDIGQFLKIWQQWHNVKLTEVQFKALCHLVKVANQGYIKGFVKHRIEQLKNEIIAADRISDIEKKIELSLRKEEYQIILDDIEKISKINY